MDRTEPTQALGEAPPPNALRARGATPAFALLALGLGASVLLGLTVGSSRLPLSDVLAALRGDAPPDVAAIVRRVRAPTVALAGMVGAYLASAGAAMQGLLRNPLADPYLLGISGGAAVGAAAVVTLGVGSGWVPLAAFAGAMVAIAVIRSVAELLPAGVDGHGSTTTLLLTGVVFNALSGAVILVAHALLAPQRSQELLLWMMGTLAPGRASGGGFAVAAMAGTIGILVLVRHAGALDVLTLGDTHARALGVSPKRTRNAVFVAAGVVTGCAVAFAGLVGFVGLLVPHLCRLALGPAHRTLIPASALAGAAFLILSDTAARASFSVAMTALPVGALTAVIGAPLFIVLLRRGLAAGTVQ